jgi:hypothetical protein
MNNANVHDFLYFAIEISDLSNLNIKNEIVSQSPTITELKME